MKFLLIKNFFVISEEESQKYFEGVRKNVLSLVHYGFSREEVYFMPIGEMIDYINIINQQQKEELEETQRKQEELKGPEERDINMAGNTLAGNVL